MVSRISGVLKLVAVLSVAAALSGCAFGRKYSYTDAPVALQGVSSTGTVAVGVQDLRPYVTSGGKSETFVGLMRGGFGNPFNVNTGSGVPLAIEIRDSIARAMRSKGITPAPIAIAPSETASTVKRRLLDTKARRLVFVTLNEWKSDTMMNTDLHYDVTLSVLDQGGNQLATTGVKGVDNLGGLGLSPNEGIARAYARKFDMLFDDEKIIAALK